MSATIDLDCGDYPTIDWPESVDDAPDGWHWGRHVSAGPRGSGYFLISDCDDQIMVIAMQRPDLNGENAPDDAALRRANLAWKAECLRAVERPRV